MAGKNSSHTNLINKATKKNQRNQPNDIKECLRSEKLSSFQILISNINDHLFYKSNKPGEIGRTRSDPRNLPAHIDRTFTTFGLSKKDPCSCSDVIHGEYINYLASDVHFERHLPGIQTNREYKYPFNKETLFGKASNADVQGNKIRKLIHSFQNNLTLNNINNSLKKSHLDTFYSMHKEIKKTSPSSIDEILQQTSLNWKIVELKKSLSHINALRLKLKKHDLSVCFLNLYEHFSCIDKDLSCTVSLDTFYHILREVNIKPDTKMFEFLLKEFNFITKNSKVYYMEALNLLNWKCEFPSLSKFYDFLPIELDCYRTTYQDATKLHQ